MRSLWAHENVRYRAIQAPSEKRNVGSFRLLYGRYKSLRKAQKWQIPLVAHM